MARPPFPLPHALHPDLVILDEFGRALLPRPDRVHYREKLRLDPRLADAIIAFLAARNENPRRYVWKPKGEDILRKINAARQALAAVQPDSNAISETAH